MVDDLKREVAASGRTDIEVRPCGCIDRCAEGPIVVVRQSGDVSGVPVRDTTHVRVQAGDVRDIVAAIGRGATNQD
ncbi:(2Fe-2S) ferredoxin domain-containing protein [Blastochloris viridis]|uniref:Ferredoxin n=1 Tax=Blastochloris viridis TaxID=1079 RepID=A0A182D450_BLAVI|nr:(2Fe-2S) ferredoxin domain-containing protein [Blastochloris viridis]BAS00220.1 hypothetical protein BV133_2626 [Blastochloris viridis]